MINVNYRNLQDSYLFATVARKVNEYKAAHPEKNVIRLGIGDVTLPLAPVVVQALTDAVAEMGRAESFRGYGEYNGYEFLRRAICGYYAAKGVEIAPDEVFVSDGAKSDVGNILDIFAARAKVLIPDPVYPVYVDANTMAGNEIIYMSGNEGNNFLPMPDENVKAEIIYMCSPNNPTGAVYTREQLQKWVDFANAAGAVILFDSAYEIFVTDKGLPTSVYQIPGAEKCVIEFSSFSKTAGFTGTRCGYTIVPHALMRGGESLNRMWLRRQSTKFNGVSYIVQRGAEAVFTPAGMGQIRESIGYYIENARLISETLTGLGIWHTGGKNAPYIWLKCPGGLGSWEFFDKLLTEADVVGTPGAGFGAQGEGFFRLSAFGSRENVIEAMRRIKRL